MATTSPSSTLAAAGKAMLTRQLSLVSGDADTATPFLLVREASGKVDDQDNGNDSDGDGVASSLPQGFSKHAIRQSVSTMSVSEEEPDEAREKAMETQFKRMTIKVVTAMTPLPICVDDRLLIPTKDKIKSGMPYLEFVWLRGARPERPTEVAFFNSSFQTVSRFVMVSPAKHLRKASFVVFSALEDNPAAVIQKNRLKSVFFLARDGEVIYSFKRTTTNLIRVYEGKRTVEAACRLGILFTDKDITIRTVLEGGLRDPIARWTASESFVGNTAQVASGCDVLLITVCFGIADFFSSPPCITAPDIAKSAVLHANPPKYIRDLMA